MNVNNETNLNLKEKIELMSEYRNNHTKLFRGAAPSVDFSDDKTGCFMVIAFVLVVWVSVYYIYTYIDVILQPYSIAITILCLSITFLLNKLIKKRKPRKQSDDTNSSIPVLWLGYSTGQLVKFWHQPGLAANQHISLSLEDACKNILVLGSIGSGKTTCVMQPLLAQALEQNWGGLIFDIKGDFKLSVQTIANTIDNERLTVIGPNSQQLNLLAGLTPEVAASFLKSTFLLSGHSIDSFWIDTATELCRNSLGVLQLLPERYNLLGLYEYLFEPDTKQIVDGELFTLQNQLEPKAQRLLKSYQSYVDNIFDKFDDKVKSNVKATVAQVLSPFNHPELIDAFCSSDNKALSMENLLDGHIYLVDMPLSAWGLGGKVVYTFIKLRFFNLMQQRQARIELNQDRPVLFMCDEYQEIVSANKDGLSDLNFWDKSRSSKTIGIISSQSISSFYAALNNKHAADALLQNFCQRVFLKTGDQATIAFARDIAGNVTTKKIHRSKGSGSSSSGNTTHDSESIIENKEFVIDAQLFRNLNPMEAIAFFTIDGHNLDDVIQLMPVFTNEV